MAPRQQAGSEAVLQSRKEGTSVNGIHDTGGMDGMGPVGYTAWEPNYHADWEKSAWAMFPLGARAGMFVLDEFRNHLEHLHPVHYLTAYYYEHWVHATEQIGKEKGYWNEAELDRRTEYYLDHPNAPLPVNDDPALVEFADWAVKNGFSAARDTGKSPKFSVGDWVTVRTDTPRGHTRRPRYIRGRAGRIELAHGEMVYPDTDGNGLAETAEHVYTVKFTSQELWGATDAHPNEAIYIDVWEPYIVPATTEGTTA
jgi:nitrile hydratase subunit beta